MKGTETWQPSKYVLTPRGLRASRDKNQVGRGSRFIGDLLGSAYEMMICTHARGRLLDLGAGKVPLYCVYRDLVDEVTCVDWQYSAHATSHLDYELDLNRPLPLPAGSYDTILVTDVLEHISNPVQLWREIARLLQPGGKALVTVPFCYWIHEAPYDYYRFTEHKLRQFCEENGLEVLSLDATGGSPEVAMDFIAKHIQGSRLLSFGHLMASKLLLALPGMRALSCKTAAYFPLGYLLVAQRPKLP